MLTPTPSPPLVVVHCRGCGALQRVWCAAEGVVDCRGCGAMREVWGCGVGVVRCRSGGA